MNENKKPVYRFSCVTEPVNQNEIFQIYFVSKGETGSLVWLGVSRSTKMKFVKFML